MAKKERMSRKEELKVIKSCIEAEIGRPLVEKEETSVEVAYDAGISATGDIIDFMDCVMERGEDTNPYELISDYMALL